MSRLRVCTSYVETLALVPWMSFHRRSLAFQVPCVVDIRPLPRHRRQVSCVIFLVLCVLWSQVLYPLCLDSKALFEAIIDTQDQAVLDPTYVRWLRGLFPKEVSGVSSIAIPLPAARRAAGLLEQLREHVVSAS